MHAGASILQTVGAQAVPRRVAQTCGFRVQGLGLREKHARRHTKARAATWRRVRKPPSITARMRQALHGAYACVTAPRRTMRIASQKVSKRRPHVIKCNAQERRRRAELRSPAMSIARNQGPTADEDDALAARIISDRLEPPATALLATAPLAAVVTLAQPSDPPVPPATSTAALDDVRPVKCFARGPGPGPPLWLVELGATLAAPDPKLVAHSSSSLMVDEARRIAE